MRLLFSIVLSLLSVKVLGGEKSPETVNRTLEKSLASLNIVGPPPDPDLSSVKSTASSSVPSNDEDDDDDSLPPEELELWSDTKKPRDELLLPPTVFLVILVRNKAHALPNFLAFIEALDYPKHRLGLFVRSDHNADNSTGILREWLSHVTPLYHSVDSVLNDTRGGYEGEKNTMDWPDERFAHLMSLKEGAILSARRHWADFAFFVDADNLLENPNVLSSLMKLRKTVVAPMLISLGRYSNWWGDMTDDLYYRRSDDYMDILNREKKGVFEVPMVHSTFLVDLRREESLGLSYRLSKDYSGPFDDIIVFAYNARVSGVRLWICNEEYFGKLIGPLDSQYGIDDDKNQFLNMKLESLFEDPPMPSSRYVSVSPSPKSKLGFDEVYLVNLKRRPDRLARMLACFEVLGIEAKWIEAVDGKSLSKSYLEALNIRQCPNYRDPYSLRDMTFGEIGCFMSHYKIWEDVVQHGHERVVIFEDDIRFEPYFKISLGNLETELKNAGLDDWDLVYLGRKRIRREWEPRVKGADNLVWPNYSYWTLSYMLSNAGAHKLLNQRPFNRMVPVDEYLPIMFDKHPEEQLKEQFSPRDLVALSAEPLLCYPTHYTGEPNYISDTEESDVIPDEYIPDAGVDDESEEEDDDGKIPAQHKTAKSMYAHASSEPFRGSLKDEL